MTPTEDPFIAECHALREGLLFAKDNRWNISISELDASKVVAWVREKDLSF